MKLLTLLLFAVSLFGQAANNCFTSGTFTTTGTSAVYDNTQNSRNCNTWVLTVNVTASISALSVQLEGAGAGSSPSFSAVTALTQTGASANPCTTATGCLIYATVYFNQFRVNLTSLTGTGTVSWYLSGSSGVSAKNGLGGGGGSPTGAAGGDLSGTYPNPTVAKVDGTSVPVNSAADQIINTTASATGQWTSVPNCTDTGGNHLNYATATHTFSCGTSSGGGGTAFGPLYSVGSVSGLTGCTHTGFTGATFTTLGSGAISFQTTNNAGSFNIEYCSIAAPATPYKITMQLITTSNTLGTNGFAGGGLAWSDGTKFTTFRVDKQSPPNMITVQMTNATTGSANQTVEAQSGVGNTGQWGSGQYLQIIDDGTNRITCYSFDGVKYFQHDSVTRTTFLTPTTIGPFITNSGIIILSWTQTSGSTCG